jgi:hypothetical protein
MVRIRRQAGHLSPMETQLLVVSRHRERSPDPEFHGYWAAGDLPGRPARGPVYKALVRLQRLGLVSTRWEEPDVALAARRPRRLLYRITDAGRLASYPAQMGARALGRRPPGPFTPGRMPPARPVSPPQGGSAARR